jgi:hypothetical protein
LTRRHLLGVLAPLLASTAASTAAAASTSAIAASSLSAALTLCLRSGSVSGFCLGCVNRRSGTAITDLRLFHKGFFGCGSVTRTIL